MQHPFQRIATVRRESFEGSDYLLAACGSKLVAVYLSSGRIVYQWKADNVTEAQPEPATNDDSERPPKRQKTAESVDPSKNIIKLAVSPNGEHAVVVTDDKAVRVFAVQKSGELSELSSRAMPKRPCAIQVLPDNATTLCGDKFGDVYSLPLLSDATSNGLASTAASTKLAEGTETDHTEPKMFKPSATDKTVHTQRNLKALASQQKQTNLASKSKEPLTFNHKLLLGHVSMLTDLTYATQQVDGTSRRYIITADRDEHIRISRGPPQTHIIEGYCLGHTEFVSKLCLVPGTDLLVSGGGDDWVGVWEWPRFQLRQKYSLKKVLGVGSVAVSGIWYVPSDVEDVIVVACEKSATLSYMSVWAFTAENPGINLWSIQHFDAPVLDLSFVDGTVLVSFDAREEGAKRIQAYQMRVRTPRDIDLQPDDEMTVKLEEVNALPAEIANHVELDDLLYGVEKLRKRGNHEEVEEG